MLIEDCSYINSQLQLEADAREALPYAFDTCTAPLGPLRQILFSCLTCNPPPSSPGEPYIPAGVCYSCSISCHGEHTLVELFNHRNFVCDCGTTRLPATSPCSLRISQKTGKKGGVVSEEATKTNTYNHNFYNKFCGCENEYDAESQKGVMYQCLGLGTTADGGCGEDWFHSSCIVGLGPKWFEEHETAAKLAKAAKPKVEHLVGAEQAQEEEEEEEEEDLTPPGFPDEEDFEHFICWKCVNANPWIKRYAGTSGFLHPIYNDASKNAIAVKASEISTGEIKPEPSSIITTTEPETSKKRKAEDDLEEAPEAKLIKAESKTVRPTTNDPAAPACRYAILPPAPSGTFSLFLKEDFRNHLCKCAECFPSKVGKHQQLLEEEENYEPPMDTSEDGDESATGTGSVRSLLDRGERALSTLDRVTAIEGAMAYSHLKDKLSSFLRPFAESGQAVGAEDVKKYFEELRGDSKGVKEASEAAAGDEKGDNRKEQGGY
jgi:E3 ubiquitin-protein ligase UBR7